MSALNDNLANETTTAQIPAGWFAGNIPSWFWAAFGALMILTHREVLRFSMLARQLGY
jgi:hypothetical protein